MKRNKSMKTVMAKPILNEEGISKEGRIVLVGASTDESKNEEEVETTTFEDIEKITREMEKERQILPPRVDIRQKAEK